MPKVILLVDDSPTELALMSHALSGKDYQIVTASDGEQALEKILEHMPDLVLLDVILPKKNGFQVCRQLRTTPETKDMKVILVTSKTMDSDRFWGLRQGADEYITKPFTREALSSAVEKLLN